MRENLIMEHIPVLKKELLSELEGLKPLRSFLDGTFGRGGHLKEVLSRFKDLDVLAVDQDEEAISFGKKSFPQVFFLHESLEKLRENEVFLKKSDSRKWDCIFLDLGVSSPQLDNAKRGFSFYKEGPLDMRMDERENLTAREILNTWPERRLFELFKEKGEIRNPQKVLRAVTEKRRKTPFQTTGDFSKLVEKQVGWRKKHFHPATAYFLALRLEVNKELEKLERFLPDLLPFLSPGGKMIVISFHSLEDRIVKNTFKEFKSKKEGQILTKKVIQPTRQEVKENPRSRSAKMRVFLKESG